MKRSLFVLAAVVALGTGCSDDDGDDGNNNNDNVAPPDLTAVTYNGGLARGFVDYADERAQDVSDVIAGLDVDVVCVQEIWQPEHVDMLAAAAQTTLPNQIFLDPMPEVNPEVACSADATEVQALEACARTNCDTVPSEELDNCVLTACIVEFGMVTPACSACMASNIGEDATIDSIFDACTQPSQVYAYGGAFGIGILTRESITTSDSSVFASTFNRRAVIHAEMETEALGTVHVFCTHLTAIFSSIPWPKPTGSWQEEQLLQITEMRDYIDEKAGTEGTVILMGDFNTGPGGSGWVAEYETNYNALAEGFSSAFVDSPGAACTYCDLNPLNGGVDHDASVLIDHILYRNFTGTTDATRILESPLTVTVDGTPVHTAYSDHYGVEATFTPDPPAQD